MSEIKRTRQVFGRIKTVIDDRDLKFEMTKEGIVISEKFSRDEPVTIPFEQLVDFRRTKFQYTIDGKLVEFEILKDGVRLTSKTPPEIKVDDVVVKIHQDVIGQPSLFPI